MLSVDELRPKTMKGPGGQTLYERIEAPGAVPKDIPPDALVLRVWQPHPAWGQLADSSVRAVREILEELVLLTRDIRGQALSRLAAAGLLIVPSEIDYADDDNASEDTDEGDAFTRDLIRTLSAAIADKATAAAVTPFVLRAAYDLCDRIRHIEFRRPRDIESSEKRKETVQRFAQGVDLPVEIVLGHASTTLSNAWQIDETLYKAYVEPKALLLTDADSHVSPAVDAEHAADCPPGRLRAHPAPGPLRRVEGRLRPYRTVRLELSGRDRVRRLGCAG